ncbi:MAG: 50S ribosome-binding GTPase [Bacteroidales bacterium]|nr:50S ribosome-binding GTPase [Bacteroidales bacterium]
MENEKRTENVKERISEISKYIMENIAPKLPDKIVNQVKLELEKMMEVLLETRPPRFVVLGRRGSGKSSLINAIFGSNVAEVGSVKSTTGIGAWYDYKNKRGKISILDTRGLGEGSLPDKKCTEKSVKDEVYVSIDKSLPDVLLFLCKAKEVDARIDEDIENLVEIKMYLQNKHGYNPPIVGIMTQVDELDPPDVVEPPYRDSIKCKNIADAKKILSKKLEAKFKDVIEVIPVSAYVRFENEKIVYDRRWNIDKLLECLIERIPKNALLELARITQIKSVQKKIANILIRSAVGITGLVGVEPIPIADLPVITGIQVSLIIGIGYISGRKMSKKSAIEFMTSMGVNVGAAFVLREIARSLIKLIPGAGNAVSGTVAAASTWAIGKAAIAYFIDKKSPEETKKIFEIEKRNRRKSKDKNN